MRAQDTKIRNLGQGVFLQQVFKFSIDERPSLPDRRRKCKNDFSKMLIGALDILIKFYILNVVLKF